MNKPKDGKVDTAAAPAALTHNPFAALQGVAAVAPSSSAAPAAGVQAAAAAKPAPLTPLQKALQAKIVVRMTRKGHGGKTVTVVEGLALSAAALEDFATDLKKGLGCGARVEDGAVVLQGDLVDRVTALLQKKGATKIVRGSG